MDLISDDYKPGADELYLNIKGEYFKNISDLLVGYNLVTVLAACSLMLIMTMTWICIN